MMPCLSDIFRSPRGGKSFIQVYFSPSTFSAEAVLACKSHAVQ